MLIILNLKNNSQQFVLKLLGQHLVWFVLWTQCSLPLLQLQLILARLYTTWPFRTWSIGGEMVQLTTVSITVASCSVILSNDHLVSQKLTIHIYTCCCLKEAYPFKQPHVYISIAWNLLALDVFITQTYCNIHHHLKLKFYQNTFYPLAQTYCT